MIDDSELLVFVLENESAFRALEYMYMHNRVSGDDARRECDINTLNLLKTKKIIDRSFLKRGTYVKSVYWISKTGKYIYELAILLRKKDEI